MLYLAFGVPECKPSDWEIRIVFTIACIRMLPDYTVIRQDTMHPFASREQAERIVEMMNRRAKDGESYSIVGQIIEV